MGILGWIILGGSAGRLGRGTGLGLLGDILVGIVGGVIGGFIIGALGGTGVTSFNLWSFVVALLGAILLLFIVRLLTVSRTSSRSGHHAGSTQIPATAPPTAGLPHLHGALRPRSGPRAG